MKEQTIFSKRVLPTKSSEDFITSLTLLNYEVYHAITKFLKEKELSEVDLVRSIRRENHGIITGVSVDAVQTLTGDISFPDVADIYALIAILKELEAGRFSK